MSKVGSCTSQHIVEDACRGAAPCNVCGCRGRGSQLSPVTLTSFAPSPLFLTLVVGHGGTTGGSEGLGNISPLRHLAALLWVSCGLQLWPLGGWGDIGGSGSGDGLQEGNKHRTDPSGT